MPKCSPDGTIKHYINRLTCATWIPQESDADMEWAMMGTLNDYSEMTSGRISRRKSSIVLPQVSFEQPSSDSTDVVKKEGQCWKERKASVDVTCEAATLMVS